MGPFYITDLDRPKSIFEADGNLMRQVNDGITADGSNLGHVTAVCLWTDINARYYRRQYNGRVITLSRIVRKPDFCLCENKGADQLRGNREADQRLCFRYTDSTNSLLSKSGISSF